MFLRLRKASAFRFLAVAMLLNLLDVGSGVLHWHGNMPMTRFCLGLLLGMAAGSILFLKGLTSKHSSATLPAS